MNSQARSLETHLQHALENAETPEAKYHIRSAIQHLIAEDELPASTQIQSTTDGLASLND